MTTENWRGINVKGGQVDIHGNTFVFQEKAASLILDQQPPNVDSFQGREDELGQIQGWVQDAAVRLIGITAPGGYGKTFLVAKVLAQVEGLSLPQLLWVSFNQPYAFATFGRWLLQQFGQAVDEKVPDEALLLAAVEQLSRQRNLLVMDNLETLLNEQGEWQEPVYGAFFQRWLSHGRHSTIILTSREGFSLPDNRQGMSRWYPLNGLTTTAGIALLTAKGIRGAEADLEQFVTLVDGHPLSLSLTAGWLLNPKKNVAPEVTYALKQDDLYRFEQIVGDHRGDPDASVGHILAASAERLTPTLKTLWHHLSVYRLAFNLAAAQAMMATATLDDLWELARRSLLQEQPIEGDVQTLEERWQFKFLPLVQRFAQQQTGALTEAIQKAIFYYLSHLKPKPWEDITDLAGHFEVFHYWCELKQYDQAVEIITGCNNFLDLQGHNQIRLELYRRLVLAWQQDTWQIEQNEDVEALLGATLNLGNAHDSLAQYSPAIEIHQLLLTLAHQINNKDYEAAALSNLGGTYHSLGQYQRAIECHQQSLEINRDIGDRQGEATVLGNLGNAYCALGDYPRAIKYYQQSLEFKWGISDRRGEASSLDGLGSAYYSLGQYQRAIECHQQSLEIERDIGNRRGEASSLSNLGDAYRSLGQYQRAIECHQQSLEIERDIGNRQGEAGSLSSLGNTYHSLEDYQRALECHQQSLKIARDIGSRHFEANSLGNLGDAYHSLEDYQRALECHQQSLKIARDIGSRQGEAISLGGLGAAYRSLGQYQRALECYQQSLEIKRDIGSRQGEAVSLGGLGAAYRSLGQYQRAIECYQQSLEIARDIGDRQGETALLGGLGNAYHSLGDYPRAINFHQQSLELERKIGNRRGEASSLQALASIYQLCGRIQESYAAGYEASQILFELGLPLEAWNFPKWIKSVITFAQKGKWQLAACFLAGFFGFPLILSILLALTLWRLSIGRFRR